MSPNSPHDSALHPESHVAMGAYEPTHVAQPDLDASVPVLRHGDAQRLNRKALAFLAGIVLLLVLMAAWVFAGGGRAPAVSAAADSEEVRIPELPQAAGAAPSVGASAEPGPAGGLGELPPLPPAEPVPLAAPPAPPPMPLHPRERSARAPTLLERRTDTAPAGGAHSTEDAYLQAMMATMPGRQPGPAPAEAPPRPAGGARYLRNADALLVRGTYIRCILETRIVTDVPGYTSCVVTEPVYSINGRNLLLPRGSKVLGQYQDGLRGPRVAVVWDRITTPDGIDVNMASPGVDGLGGAGHPGRYDAHWGERIGSALMISLISDVFKYAGARNGPPTRVAYGGTVAEMPFESNTARTLQGLAEQALDEAAARRPTVTLDQGTVVNVYVARDIDFSAVLGG